LRWAAKLERSIFSEKELRRSLRQTKIKEEEFDLLLAHLKFTGKMATEEININNEKIRLLKLAPIGSKDQPVIDDKEKAVFVLEQNISAIDEKVSDLQIKTQHLNNDIKKTLKMGSKEGAKYLLMRRKNLEKFWENLLMQKYQLEH
jgi:hypothetical protein